MAVKQAATFPPEQEAEVRDTVTAHRATSTWRALGVPFVHEGGIFQHVDSVILSNINGMKRSRDDSRRRCLYRVRFERKSGKVKKHQHVYR